MTRNDNAPEPLVTRPKRALVKSADDNVLGISWKEERELRKAMYVSLRDSQQQQQQQSNLSEEISAHQSRLSSLRSHLQSSLCATNSANDGPPDCKLSVKNKSGYVLKLRSASMCMENISNFSSGINEKLVTKSESGKTKINSKLKRDANNQVKTRINNKEPTSERMQRCTNKPSHALFTTSNQSRYLSKRLKSYHVHKIGSSNRNRSTNALVTNGRYSLNSGKTYINTKSMSHSNSTLSRNRVERPTLMNASNELKTSEKKRITGSRNVIYSSYSNSHGKSPITQSVDSNKGPLIETKPNRSRSSMRSNGFVHSSQTVLSDPTTSDDKKENSSNINLIDATSKRFTKPDNHRDLQTLFKSPPEPIPPELWQDPLGLPVCVHDFIDFVCYHECKCSDPKMNWFKEPHSLRKNLKSSDFNQPNFSKCELTTDKINMNLFKSNKNSSSIKCICENGINSYSNKTNEVNDNINNSFVKVVDQTDSQHSNLSPSKSSTLYVAKKLASIQPVPVNNFSKPNIPLKTSNIELNKSNLSKVTISDTNTSNIKNNNSQCSTAQRKSINSSRTSLQKVLKTRSKISSIKHSSKSKKSMNNRC